LCDEFFINLAKSLHLASVSDVDLTKLITLIMWFMVTDQKYPNIFTTQGLYIFLKAQLFNNILDF